MKQALFFGIISVLFNISIFGQGENDTVRFERDTSKMQIISPISSPKSSDLSVSKKQQKEYNISEKDCYGKNALMYSCEANDLERTSEILNDGSSVNDTSSIGYTPLMYAIEKQGINPELVDLLVMNGAKVDFINSKKQSAFSLACLYNNRELAYYLLDHGAKISECDFESNARMNNFSGDYFLAKGDLNSSKEFYKEAKRFYSESLAISKQKLSNVDQELSNVNRENNLKALSFLSDVLSATASNIGHTMMVTNSMQSYQAIGISKSNAKMMASNDLQMNQNMTSSISDKNKSISSDYQLSGEASLEEQKVFHKDKINQLELSVKLIDCILVCIDKGLIGVELNSCITNSQLKEESKNIKLQKKKKDMSERAPDYYY